MESAKGSRVPLRLLGLYVLVFGALGVHPLYRSDWLLESLVPAVTLAVLLATYRRFRFSNLAYGALFVLFVAHTIGSHYTYAEVPAGFWAARRFGWERNHFDRLVHFLYGCLAAPAAVELADAKAPSRGLWSWIMPTLFLASHSMLYEIIEWWAAVTFGGGLGVAYLGIQGDVWDAQKDMALGALGAALAVAVLRLTAAAAPESTAPPPPRTPLRASSSRP